MPPKRVSHPIPLTRTSSSSSSALSNIPVAAVPVTSGASAPRGKPKPQHIASSTTSEQAEASVTTPMTSLNDEDAGSAVLAAVAGAEKDAEEEVGGRRTSGRARGGRRSYNLKELSNRQLEEEEGGKESRNVSGLTGRTLVDGEDVEMGDAAEEVKAKTTTKPAIKRKQGFKEHAVSRGKKMMGTMSVLGKRSWDAGKKKLGTGKEGEDAQGGALRKSRYSRELDTGPKGLLDEMDLDEEFDAPAPRPVKKLKRENTSPLRVMAQPTGPPLKDTKGRRAKKWQKEGLYVGQDPTFDPEKKAGRKTLLKKRPGSSASNATQDTTGPKRSFMTLPMFSYLDKSRDFVIPFDIFAPSGKRGDEKPKDWSRINRNRLVGEARDIQQKAPKGLPNSTCDCKPSRTEITLGCDVNCLNALMSYECDANNCKFGNEPCGNRPFAEIAERTKEGGAYNLGVEVVKTSNRGFGVRSCRTFAPGQIIMEYTGEIISEGECQRRMREEYMDKQCYYLMELEGGLIIDGTKGSMARFINHSCEPNCEVRMMKVKGVPRMGVFAGEGGVMTGEELTYDYNFDNFGATQQICHCGAATCRGFLSKRLNAAEQKRVAKEEEVKQRKAAEDARKLAEAEARKKKAKTERGSNWRGWVAVDDPETKKRLIREKAEREEAERSSGRAQRMAKRRGSLPAEASAPLRTSENAPTTTAAEKKRRRRTVQIHQQPPAAHDEPQEEDGPATTTATTETKTMKDIEEAHDGNHIFKLPLTRSETFPSSSAHQSQKKKTQPRPKSSSSVSKFSEDLPESHKARESSSPELSRRNSRAVRQARGNRDSIAEEPEQFDEEVGAMLQQEAKQERLEVPDTSSVNSSHTGGDAEEPDTDASTLLARPVSSASAGSGASSGARSKREQARGVLKSVKGSLTRKESIKGNGRAKGKELRVEDGATGGKGNEIKVKAKGMKQSTLNFSKTG